MAKKKEYWLVTHAGRGHIENLQTTVIDYHPIEISKHKNENGRQDIVLWAVPVTKEQYDAAENIQ